jgi:NADPH:quinone reductase-like Zn-dependent oxidoreductase
MNAIELTAPRLDALRRTTLPDPVPQRGEVLIRLPAATLNYLDVAVALICGRGAELVVETVGAATLARSLNAAALGGTVFTVGFLGGTAAAVDLLPVIGKALRIVPVIDQVFELGDASAAYAQLASGRHVGKLAIVH